MPDLEFSPVVQEFLAALAQLPYVEQLRLLQAVERVLAVRNGQHQLSFSGRTVPDWWMLAQYSWDLVQAARALNTHAFADVYQGYYQEAMGHIARISFGLE